MQTGSRLAKRLPVILISLLPAKKRVYSRRFPILHDRMCFACKLCLFSSRSPTAAMRILCRCLLLHYPASSRFMWRHPKKCGICTENLRQKDGIEIFATPSFTAKGWKLYGKNMARVRQKYGVYTERPPGAKFPGSVLA